MAADSSTKRCLSFSSFSWKISVLRRYFLDLEYSGNSLHILCGKRLVTCSDGKPNNASVQRAAKLNLTNVTNPSESQLLAWTMEEKKEEVQFYICGIFRPFEGRNFSFSYKHFHGDLRGSGRYLVS